LKAKVDALLTFVIIGAGPTGVELAGALSEIARHTLRGNFRYINAANSKIILIEGADRVLGPYPAELSQRAARDLEQLGVTVLTNSKVTDITDGKVTFKTGDKTEELRAYTILWAAGVQASPLGKVIAQATGAEIDKAGRVIVEPDLSVKGHPEIFVIGDLASFKHGTEKPLPGVAPVAMQQGRYVADLIYARLNGKTMPAFKYHDRGSMATIGRARAVADLGCCKFTGYLAWLLWLFVHLMYIVQFQNRVLILLQWAWNYFTRNRAARLITDTAESVALNSSKIPMK
jgi:NADH dehydrogenase